MLGLRCVDIHTTAGCVDLNPRQDLVVEFFHVRGRFHGVAALEIEVEGGDADFPDRGDVFDRVGDGAGKELPVAAGAGWPWRLTRYTTPMAAGSRPAAMVICRMRAMPARSRGKVSSKCALLLPSARRCCRSDRISQHKADLEASSQTDT
jgi:hypothetical protein